MKIPLFITLALMAAIPCHSASFDCARAKGRTEALICSDAGLSQLDERLSEAYRGALSRASNRAAVVRWQREWLKSYPLAACKDSVCLSKEFASRIELLSQVSSEDEGVRWTGVYTRLISGKEDDSARLVLVRLVGNKLFIGGIAYWTGWNAGQINTGEINGIGTVSDRRVVFDLDGCQGVIVIRGARLIVESEDGCGGMNVSFVGEYRRK